MHLNIRLHYWLLALLLVLSGCASNRPDITIDPARGVPLSELNHWQLKARVAIKTPEENVTASLNWQKNGPLFDFYLSGAFGVTIAHLVQDDVHATLEIPDSEKLFHTNAEQLLQQTLGWQFPIDALSYWVKGLPSHQAGEQVSYDEQGRINQITLNQWQIEFSKYRKFQGYLLPKMIQAKHPQLSIKVVAKKWLFLE